MFSREDLQLIRDKALELVEDRTTGYGNNWRAAIYKLANAADHLDAMIARTEVKEGS